MDASAKNALKLKINSPVYNVRCSNCFRLKKRITLSLEQCQMLQTFRISGGHLWVYVWEAQCSWLISFASFHSWNHVSTYFSRQRRYGQIFLSNRRKYFLDISETLVSIVRGIKNSKGAPVYNTVKTMITRFQKAFFVLSILIQEGDVDSTLVYSRQYTKIPIPAQEQLPINTNFRNTVNKSFYFGERLEIQSIQTKAWVVSFRSCNSVELGVLPEASGDC